MSTHVNTYQRFLRAFGTTSILIFSFSIVAFIHLPDRGLGDGASGQGTRATQAQTGSRDKEPDRKANPAKPFNYHALVIGINEYDNWMDLRTARNDATEVARVLSTDYGFNVTLLLDKDASKKRIDTEFKRFLELTDQDAILVYFAGHGTYNERAGKGYWIPADAGKKGSGKEETDYIPNKFVQNHLAISPARHALLVSDSCYAGSLFRGGSAEKPKDNRLVWYKHGFAKFARQLITSGDNQPVADGDGLHSVFAYSLLERLRQEEPKVFSARELGFEVCTRAAVPGQHGRVGRLRALRDNIGEFMFVRKTATFPFNNIKAEDVEFIGVTLRQGDREGALDRLNQVSRDNDPDLYDALANQIHAELQAAEDKRIQELIAALNKQVKETPDGNKRPTDRSRPRILTYPGLDAKSIAAAPLFDYYLRHELEENGLTVVTRDLLPEALREQFLNGLGDEAARLEVGNLLPASFLLRSSNLVDTVIALRLIDTETTVERGGFELHELKRKTSREIAGKLATEVRARLDQRFPLFCETLEFNGNEFNAPIGEYHGLLLDTPLGLFREGKIVASVEVSDIDDFDSSFTAKLFKDKDGKDIPLGKTASLRLEAIPMALPKNEDPPLKKKAEPEGLQIGTGRTWSPSEL